MKTATKQDKLDSATSEGRRLDESETVQFNRARCAQPSAAALPPPRARRSWLKRLLEYSGATVALIAAVLLVSFVVGFFEGFLPSSSPGDPSSAGVIDSDAFWSPDSRLIAFDRSDYGPPR